MVLAHLPDLLAVASGVLVGFTLGLVGGGGSILAVPLLLYVVDIGSPHLAIGTSAVAVAANALANFASHARAGNVSWPSAVVFALAGIAGAWIGAGLGKAMDGQRLLLLFAAMMVVVAFAMLCARQIEVPVDPWLGRRAALRLGGIGFLTGGMSGFFGIGGGFLIVPGLMLGAGLPILRAVGSSLLSVAAFGLTTAVSYSLSDLVDWRLVGFFIAGGLLGGLGGTRAAIRLSRRRNLLTRVLAGVILGAAAYILLRTLAAPAAG